MDKANTITVTAPRITQDVYVKTTDDGTRPTDFLYGAYGIYADGVLVGKVTRPSFWRFTPTDGQESLNEVAGRHSSVMKLRAQIAKLIAKDSK